MGLFDKKYCDICGEKIGLLGNRKLEDGNLCKNCAKKLSPWFDDRRHSTVDQIKEQLAYRERNLEVVKAFKATKVFGDSGERVFVDEAKQQFTIAYNVDEKDNPDIMNFSQLKSCYLDIVEDEEREYREDKDGDREFIGYKYFYSYHVYFSVDSPYFDEIKLNLNTLRIPERNHHERHKLEKLGRDIEYYFKNLNNAPTVSQQEAPKMVNNGPWICQSCGGTNTGRFCENCGSPRNA